MNAQKLTATALTLLATACFGVATAKATVIFNNFGPGGSYTQDVGWTVGTSGPYDFVPFMSFLSSDTYQLTQIDVALGYYQGPNTATVGLWTDVGGVPTTELQSWGVSAQGGLDSTGIASIKGIAGVTLLSGESYYLQIAPGSATTNDDWCLNDANSTGLVYLTNHGVGSIYGVTTEGAFEVLGTRASASEPGSVTLFAAGLAGLGLWLRRRKQAPTHY